MGIGLAAMLAAKGSAGIALRYDSEDTSERIHPNFKFKKSKSVVSWAQQKNRLDENSNVFFSLKVSQWQI